MIVITGGSGFIGSVLLWKLNQQGYKDILIVDQFDKSPKWKNLNGKLYKDIVEKNEFRKLLHNSAFLNNCKVIFHMGACSSTTEDDLSYLLDNNTNYSKELFNFCTIKQIPFIYASSAATYGNGEKGYSDQLKEQLSPINPYGFSKHVFDLWATRQRACPPLLIGLKFFNVYGPNEYHKDDMKSIVAKAVPQIKQNKSLKLFKSYKKDIADGEQQRDFVYVKDVANIMFSLWKKYYEKTHDITSGVYNLGTGQARSFVELGRAVFSALKQKENFEWIEMPDSIKNQYQYFTQSDNSRLYKNTLSCDKFTSLEDGIKDYVVNYLNEEKFL
jgi:ADP-L-glycero-D-manno-heptose 6-epimerase